MKLTQTVADRIAARMRRDGFEHCDAGIVFEVYDKGYLALNEALASRILNEFDEYAIEALDAAS